MNIAQLQQALWTRLDAQVGASFVGIYHDVPQAEESEDDAAFPYITLGPYNASAFDDKTQLGGDVLFQVHLWTRTHDNLVRSGLRDSVYDALHRYDLVIAGTDYANLIFESSDDFADPDGKTRHIVMRFRVIYMLT